MEKHFQRAEVRLHELEQLLGDPTTVADRQRFATLSREYADIQNAFRYRNELDLVTKARQQTAELLRTTGEPELKRLAEEELRVLDRRHEELSEKIREVLEPPDPRDRKDTVLEIRSGAGGDEASLFAAELLRMYLRYAERHGWKTQLVSESRTSVGGYKEVIVELSGGPVFRDLKYESGVHRVQRVPETEKAGRVHTSTATVIVLPEADEVEVSIDPKDLEITATTASGHGGQSVNTTYSAIRVLHKPTGIIVSCQDERSQMQNKEKALRILRARLLAHREEQRQREASATRRSLIGTGDRSEKIRTYNVPQDRVTDHRIKQSLHGIDRVLDGELEPMIMSLRTAERNAALSARA